MNKLCLLIISFILSVNVFAQKIEKAEFADSAFYERPGELLQGYDAGLIFQKRVLYLGLGAFENILREETHTKTVILTKKGITDYGQVIVPKEDGRTLTKLAVRTIKKNGTVINFDLNDIKQLDIANELDIYQKNKYILFAVPGVEVGDEIDAIYVFESYVSLSDDIYMNGLLPCMQSTFTLLTSSGMETEIRVFNGLQQPKVSNETLVHCYWEYFNLPGTGDQDFLITEKELPYFRYAVRNVTYNGRDLPILKRNWVSYTDQIFMITEASKQKVKGFSSFLDKKFGKIEKNATADMKLKKLVAIHRYISDSIKVDWLTKGESEESLLKMLSRKTIDHSNLVVLYDNVFDYLEINYYLGFGRNRYAGEFDVNFVAPHMITNSFMAFELDGFFYFLFLKDNFNSYELGEVPIDLQGTNAMLISKMPLSDRVKQVKLITTEKSSNYRRVKITANIKLNEPAISGIVKRQYAGSMATSRRALYKNFSSEEIKNNFETYFRYFNPNLHADSIRFDNSSGYKFPYLFNLDYTYSLKDAGIVQLDSNLFSISLDKWFENIEVPATSPRRIADFYSEFQYTDNIKYYLKFDEKVEVNNGKTIESTIANDFGTYYITVKQINETIVLLESHYEVKSEVLKKENYQMIRDLENELKKANSRQLVIKTIR